MSIRDHLIADWKQAHKFISMRVAALGAGLQTAFLLMPQRILDHVPEHVQNGAAIFCFVGVAMGVLKAQKLGDKGAGGE